MRRTLCSTARSSANRGSRTVRDACAGPVAEIARQWTGTASNNLTPDFCIQAPKVQYSTSLLRPEGMVSHPVVA